MNKPEEQTKTTAIAKKETTVVKRQDDSSIFARYQRDSRLLMASSFLPDHFCNPKDSPERKMANVCIAMELASHYKDFGPLEVIQQMYFIGGQPSWKSSFVISLLKSQGLKVMHEEEGDWENPDETTRTRCVAIDKQGIKYKSTWITPKTVKQEGWDKKPGSKWLSMPAQMARYRSAAFLARVYWPELLMGYYTADERADFTDGRAAEDVYQDMMQDLEPPSISYTPPESVAKTESYDYSKGPSQDQWNAAMEKLGASSNGEKK